MNPTPAQLVAHLAATGRRPAALVGDWFGHAAVVAVDCAPRPVAGRGASAFSLDDAPSRTSSPDSDEWRFGWLPYSGKAFSAETRDVLFYDVPADAAANADGASDSSAAGTWSVAPGASAELAAELPALLADAAAFALPEDPAIAWDAGDRAAHERGVLDCLDAIRAGDVYQACLSTRFHGTVEPAPSTSTTARTSSAPDAATPLPSTVSGTTPNPTVMAAAGWWARRVVAWARARGIPRQDRRRRRDMVVASLSRRSSGARWLDGAESPIKGTIADFHPAGWPPRRRRREHHDRIDGAPRPQRSRGDRGVRVTDLLAVRPAPGVWHLVSEVTATLPETLPHADLIDACFPPASVTGTPKNRAAELLSEWEPVARGVHCGAIGASTGEMLELNVAIRTAEFRGPGSVLHDADADAVTVEAGVGGGITIDSDPAAEWDEILAKAAPLLHRT